MEARPFPRPAAHFPLQLGCGVFAVCGGHILGLSSRSQDTFIYDTAARTITLGPQLCEPKSRLALLLIGDDAVLVMDLQIPNPMARDGALSRSWTPLVGYDGPLHITAYLAASARA